MRNHDRLVGMQGSLLVLVHLRVQCTDLHVRLALVLEHFQFERRVHRVVEVVLNILTIQVNEALL